MKIITLLTLAICFQAAADVKAQKVTLRVKEKPLEYVLNEIQKQSGYSFIYNTEYLKSARPVSLEITETDILKVLPIIFKEQPLNYRVKDKVITLFPKHSLIELENKIQQQEVHGKVTDSLGKPLAGVTVRVKNTHNAVATNAAGIFTLTNIDLNSTIQLSLVGYHSKEIILKGETQITIVLNLTSAVLDESVIIGYGTTTKRLNTGSVSSIKAEDIQKQPVSNPLLTLQGRLPGLYISQNSGVPGANIGTIRLRGQNSIANGNEPLFLIDGIPFSSESLTSSYFGGGAAYLSPFNSLDPSDIESIDVLKDADATAIYGSRGANGVVLITTKKGKAGKTKIDINAYQAIGKIASKLDLLNTQEYFKMRSEAFKNDATIPNTTDYDLNGTWDTTRYTDWQDTFIGGTAKTSDIKASISGGNNQTQFLISSGYRKESTVYPGDFFDKKISIRTNINHQSTSKNFNLQFTSSYMINVSELPTSDLVSNIFLAPNAPAIYDAKGNLNWENSTWNNPFATLLRDANSNTSNLIGNLVLSYKISKDIQLKSSLGYNKIRMDQHILTPLTSYDPGLNPKSTRRSHYFPSNDRNSWIVEPQILYDKKIGDLQLNALLGITFQESKQEAIAQSARDFINDELITNLSAAVAKDIGSYTYNQYRYNALFSRINLNWKDKYILNLTGRRDGSSRFGPNNKFGNFGAVGAAWIISEEDFFNKTFPIVSFAKFNASYGITGNDQISDYQYLSSYATYPFPYQNASTLYPIRIANPDYGWETVKKLELGVNLGFIKNRLLLNVGYYNNKTTDQLVGYSLPVITGFSSIIANLPAVIQNSGLEIEFNSTNIQNSNLTWKSSFNITIPKNKLLSYPDIENSTYANRYEVGKSLYIQKKIHSLGVDPKTGYYIFEDYNNDGSISAPDDYQSLKELSQKFYGGFQNSLSYKDFTLDFFIQFVNQTGRNAYYYSTPAGFYNQNQLKESLKRWQNPGDISPIGSATQSFSSEATNSFLIMQQASDLIFSDASFARLKNLSISYHLSNALLQKIEMKSCNIYLQAQNLFTLTDFFGFDPESNQGKFLPPLKVYSLGVQFSL